jgi:hypothetical protein
MFEALGYGQRDFSAVLHLLRGALDDLRPTGAVTS